MIRNTKLARCCDWNWQTLSLNKNRRKRENGCSTYSIRCIADHVDYVCQFIWWTTRRSRGETLRSQGEQSMINTWFEQFVLGSGYDSRRSVWWFHRVERNWHQTETPYSLLFVISIWELQTTESVQPSLLSFPRATASIQSPWTNSDDRVGS